jgi:hypothetical protein
MQRNKWIHWYNCSMVNTADWSINALLISLSIERWNEKKVICSLKLTASRRLAANYHYDMPIKSETWKYKPIHNNEKNSYSTAYEWLTSAISLRRACLHCQAFSSWRGSSGQSECQMRRWSAHTLQALPKGGVVSRRSKQLWCSQCPQMARRGRCCGYNRVGITNCWCSQ